MCTVTFFGRSSDDFESMPLGGKHDSEDLRIFVLPGSLSWVYGDVLYDSAQTMGVFVLLSGAVFSRFFLRRANPSYQIDELNCRMPNLRVVWTLDLEGALFSLEGG